jgi:glycosyltransferase involved in cell wall biosynthesis
MTTSIASTDPQATTPRCDRPRLLFAARRPPFPLVNGSRIRTHRLLTGLATTFETTFVTFDHDPRSVDGHVDRDELRRLLPGIDVVTVAGCGPGKRLRQLRAVGRRRSWEYGRYERPEMARVLRKLGADLAPDVVHFDDLGVAQFGPLETGLNVYSAHNVEHRILESTIEYSRGLRRSFARTEHRKVAVLERRVWQAMDLCLACSDLDAQQMLAGGALVKVCPNGADPVEPFPTPVRDAGQPFRILFVGALDYLPNQLGLEWFATEVLPELRRRLACPLIVDLVGTAPPHPPADPELLVHGRVPSVEPFYEQAHAVVVPVMFGSGTRLKMIEAMAYGRPVVATTAGAEGLPAVPGADYFQADDPAAFAKALSVIADRCERRHPRLARMLGSARGAIEPLLWPNIVNDLRRHYATSAPGGAGSTDGDRALRKDVARA